MGDPCDTPGKGGGGGGDPDFSFIWIANSSEGTVSKIDTVTMLELGRYRTRMDAAGSPSRTSVNLNGDVAVANRNGGVAKFWANVNDCQDSNGTPGIQTSTGASDILAFEDDDCMAWYHPWSCSSQRPRPARPAQSSGWSDRYNSMTFLRSVSNRGLSVRTFMPSATAVVHDAGNPLRPSISTRQRRHEPNAFKVSVAQSLGI